MATMQFQRIAKETTSGGTLWEDFMPQETKAQIAEQADALVKTISDGRLDRPLLSAVASFPALSGHGVALAAGLPAQRRSERPGMRSGALGVAREWHKRLRRRIQPLVTIACYPPSCPKLSRRSVECLPCPTDHRRGY